MNHFVNARLNAAANAAINIAGRVARTIHQLSDFVATRPGGQPRARASARRAGAAAAAAASAPDSRLNAAVARSASVASIDPRQVREQLRNAMSSYAKALREAAPSLEPALVHELTAQRAKVWELAAQVAQASEAQSPVPETPVMVFEAALARALRYQLSRLAEPALQALFEALEANGPALRAGRLTDANALLYAVDLETAGRAMHGVLSRLNDPRFVNIRHPGYRRDSIHQVFVNVASDELHQLAWAHDLPVAAICERAVHGLTRQKLEPLAQALKADQLRVRRAKPELSDDVASLALMTPRELLMQSAQVEAMDALHAIDSIDLHASMLLVAAIEQRLYTGSSEKDPVEMVSAGAHALRPRQPDELDHEFAPRYSAIFGSRKAPGGLSEKPPAYDAAAFAAPHERLEPAVSSYPLASGADADTAGAARSRPSTRIPPEAMRMLESWHAIRTLLHAHEPFPPPYGPTVPSHKAADAVSITS